jgi:hypothetical protein
MPALTSVGGKEATMVRHLTLVTALGAIAALSTGCTSRQQELEAVAKDWCLTIRASQIMPVYPLREDVQPGDCFLVSVPVDQQQKVWEAKGFLPLDQQFLRVRPSGYAAFYQQSFPVTNEQVPLRWLTPAAADKAPLHQWQSAPASAFPTYSFQVKKGGGFNLALPIEGVPVGLSLLGASEATGAVVISDARTYGVDMATLMADVERALDTVAKEGGPTNRQFLAQFYDRGEPVTATSKGRVGTPVYLRIISRVFLAGSMDVSIQNAESQAAGASAGNFKPVDLLDAKAGDAKDLDERRKTYELGRELIAKKLTEVAAGAMPGGSLQFQSASARSISLKETFARPLVIGYLALDCRIEAGGRLSPAIPTLQVLGGQVPPAVTFSPLQDSMNGWRAVRMTVPTSPSSPPSAANSRSTPTAVRSERRPTRPNAVARSAMCSMACRISISATQVVAPGRNALSKPPALCPRPPADLLT